MSAARSLSTQPTEGGLGLEFHRTGWGLHQKRVALVARAERTELERGPNAAYPSPRWTPWRELLKRSFGVDGWACPYCDQRMRLRAVVLPPATHKILRGLQAACRAPPGADAMAG